MDKQKLPKIKYIIVCDDMREEKDSGKFTLLGVYSGNIIFDTLPAILPKIAFRICVSPVRNIEVITLELIRPDRKLIGSGQLKMAMPEDHRGEAFLNLVLSPFPIEVSGPYNLVLKQGEKTISKAVAFEAVQKESKKK